MLCYVYAYIYITNKCTLFESAADLVEIGLLALGARVAGQTALGAGQRVARVVAVARVLRHTVDAAVGAVPVVVTKRRHLDRYADGEEKQNYFAIKKEQNYNDFKFFELILLGGRRLSAIAERLDGKEGESGLAVCAERGERKGRADLEVEAYEVDRVELGRDHVVDAHLEPVAGRLVVLIERHQDRVLDAGRHRHGEHNGAVVVDGRQLTAAERTRVQVGPAAQVVQAEGDLRVAALAAQLRVAGEYGLVAVAAHAQVVVVGRVVERDELDGDLAARVHAAQCCC